MRLTVAPERIRMTNYRHPRRAAWVLCALLYVLAAADTAALAVWKWWWYPTNYEYALNLADDAALPDQKAAYLREYLSKVEAIKGPPRYVFMRPDLDLETQRTILRGLVSRFDELAKIKQSEMAYQQGMYQLTGQEIDHQLAKSSDTFEAAKLRESRLLFLLLAVLPVPLWIAAVVFTLKYGI